MSGLQQMVLSLTKWDGKERQRGGTEALLAALRFKAQPMTAAELEALTGELASTVNARLRRHIDAGRVIRAGELRCATYVMAEVQQ